MATRLVVQLEGELVTSWMADGERFFLIKKPVEQDDDEDSQEDEDEEEYRKRGAAKWRRDQWQPLLREPAKGSAQKRRKKSG